MSVSDSDNLSIQDHLRPVLVLSQGVAVSGIDAGRIVAVKNGIAAALAQAAGQSEFGTEPADFDRDQTVKAGQDADKPRAAS